MDTERPLKYLLIDTVLMFAAWAWWTVADWFRGPDLLTERDLDRLNQIDMRHPRTTWCDEHRYRQGADEIGREFYSELGGEG